AMITIIVPISALTYPIAIVLPKKDIDAKVLIRLSLYISSIISIIALIILILFKEQITNIFNVQEISSYLYLIPLVVIFSGLMQVSEQWLIRTKQFSINARVTFIHSIIVNGSKVGIGLFHPVAAVLVVLTALGNGIRAFMMIIFSKRSKYKINENKNDKPESIKSLAKK